MKGAHKHVRSVALTAIVAQVPDEARSIEYQMKVELVAQCCLRRLSRIALDVFDQNFQRGICVESGDLAIYQGCCNCELVGASYDAGERSQ